MEPCTTAIILAGGFGTRLKPVVSDVPKPMAPVKDRPFLEYLLDFWIDQGVREFVLSVGYRKEIIRGHFGNRYRNTVIEYSIENRPLGTGGGLLLALRAKVRSDPVLVLNGDTLFDVCLPALLAEHDRSGAGMTLALHETSGGGRYSVVDPAPDGRITALYSRDSGAPSHYVNGGVYVLDPGIFDGVGTPSEESVSLEDHLLPDLIERGVRVQGYPSKGHFIDIGLPDDYLRLESWLGQRGFSRRAGASPQTDTIGGGSE